MAKDDTTTGGRRILPQPNRCGLSLQHETTVQEGSSKTGSRLVWIALGIFLLGAQANASQSQADAKPAHIARQVDQLISEALFDESTPLAPRTDDAMFLRRIWLDIVGDIPPPEGVIGFVIDPSPHKRRTMIRRLLDETQYGQNWARYWSDVIFSRRVEDRALQARDAMVFDLTVQLNDNQGWDKIATDYITALGDVQSDGSTALLMAQAGQTEQMTAEVSRLFLGLQIGCAQCHDHPQDRWKREQFHELAAFFPRIGVRAVRTLTRRSFEIYATNRQGKKRPNVAQRPQMEHYMPNLQDPLASGTRMKPKFFLTGASLPLGTSDEIRRQKLALWLTESPWFATAIVNRLVSELLGEGFYNSVEDIGPDRQPRALKAMELLSHEFREHGFDLKWLIETICLTEAYQREARPRRGPEDIPFTANVPQPLRGDQLFNVLNSVLEMDETAGKNRRGKGSARARNLNKRKEFNLLFAFDPSVDREEVALSIPQALALMNQGELNQAIAGHRKSSLLGKLLLEVADETSLVNELYLRTLSREPTPGELERALNYLEDRKSSRPSWRREAYEDLLWVFVNSTEFRCRM